MNSDYYQVYLTKEEAEKLVFTLPNGYSLISTEMERNTLEPEPQLHLEIVLNGQINERQKRAKISLSSEDNSIANDILMVLEGKRWRFKILEEILIENNQKFTSFGEINMKIIQKRYRNFNGFLADLNCLISNSKLRQLNRDYKEQAQNIGETLDKLRHKFKLEQELPSFSNQLSIENHQDNKDDNEITFTEEEYSELYTILPQLQPKYLNNLKKVVGSACIQKRKDKSEYLNLSKLSSNEKLKLLKHVRKCLREQTKNIKMERSQSSKSSKSGFESSAEMN